MTYVTIYVDSDTALKIASDYDCHDIRCPQRAYEVFLGDKDGCNVKGYVDKNGHFSIVLSSYDDRSIVEAEKYKDKFIKWYKISRTDLSHLKGRDSSISYRNTDDQIGSDEVGVGDFFGPLVVCCARTSNSDIPLLKELKVTDSKKLKDQYIIKIAPILKEKIPNYVISMSAEKLSELVKSGINPHKALAICHNFTHKGIKEKYHISDLIPTYVDAFTTLKYYRLYLGDDLVSKNITLKTQGELAYPSVAVASIIARYTFLNSWKDMCDKLSYDIPKGANELTDKVYQQLCKKKGSELVDCYVKKFFANYKKAHTKKQLDK